MNDEYVCQPGCIKVGVHTQCRVPLPHWSGEYRSEVVPIDDRPDVTKLGNCRCGRVFYSNSGHREVLPHKPGEYDSCTNQIRACCDSPEQAPHLGSCVGQMLFNDDGTVRTVCPRCGCASSVARGCRHEWHVRHIGKFAALRARQVGDEPAYHSVQEYWQARLPSDQHSCEGNPGNHVHWESAVHKYPLKYYDHPQLMSYGRQVGKQAQYEAWGARMREYFAEEQIKETPYGTAYIAQVQSRDVDRSFENEVQW